MDQKACLLAVRKLIYDNRTSLVSGLAHQGVARTLKTVTVSVHVPPTGYYYILVQLRRSEEVSKNPRSNISKPDPVAFYQVTLHVSDAAFPQAGEDYFYEEMTLDFRTFCDRVVTLFRDAGYFTADSPNDSSRFNLERGTGQKSDRVVRVINLDSTWRDEETNALGAILYSTIDFVLEERCQT